MTAAGVRSRRLGRLGGAVGSGRRDSPAVGPEMGTQSWGAIGENRLCAGIARPNGSACVVSLPRASCLSAAAVVPDSG